MVAEGEGLEPPIPVKGQRFSGPPACQLAQPSIRKNHIIKSLDCQLKEELFKYGREYVFSNLEGIVAKIHKIKFSKNKI